MANFNNGTPGNFAGQFIPAQVGQLFQNPQLLLNDLLRTYYGVGAPEYSPASFEYGDIANMAPMMWMLQHGGTMAPNASYDASATLNDMAKFINGQISQPGNYLNSTQLLGNLFGNNPATSALGMFMTGDPSTQIQSFNSLLAPALSGYNPMIQSLFAKAAKLQEDAWQNARARYPQAMNESLAQWMQNNPNSVFRNFGTPTPNAQQVAGGSYASGGSASSSSSAPVSSTASSVASAPPLPYVPSNPQLAQRATFGPTPY